MNYNIDLPRARRGFAPQLKKLRAEHSERREDLTHMVVAFGDRPDKSQDIADLRAEVKRLQDEINKLTVYPQEFY